MARPSRKFLLVSAILLVVLVALFGGMYGLAQYKRTLQQRSDTGAVSVAIDAKTCQPMDLTVPAGRTTFEIENRSDRAVEWEILNGVIVVAERENIAPGFKQRLTARLEPGQYEITCGLLSNPRGKLVVTESEASAAAARNAPALADLIGPLAEYQVTLGLDASDLVDATSGLADAVAAGDLAQAQSLYAAARVPFGRLEPAAELFADLANAVDGQADYVEQKEQDPHFTGFHRLEYGLFHTRSLEGMEPVARQLQANAQAVADRISDLTVTPQAMVGGAGALLDKIVTSRLDGRTERYSDLYLVDLAANLEGIDKVASLLQPVVNRSNKELSAGIARDMAAVRSILDKYRGDGSTFQAYSHLSEADRTALKNALDQVSRDFARLQSVLGMD
jgi:iron uptake system component EfeO